MRGRGLAPAMRAFPLALLVLSVPVAFAATSATDEPGDERIVLPLANAAKVDPNANLLGCSAPAVDIVLVTSNIEGNDGLLRFRVVDMDGRPSCRGRALEGSRTHYLLDLENEGYSILSRGGDNCESRWSCIRLAKHGAGSYVDTVPGSGGTLQGDEWTIRIPLSGRTTTGRVFDLRGETFDVHAYAEQTQPTTGMLFSDSASGVATLR